MLNVNFFNLKKKLNILFYCFLLVFGATKLSAQDTDSTAISQDTISIDTISVSTTQDTIQSNDSLSLKKKNDIEITINY